MNHISVSMCNRPDNILEKGHFQKKSKNWLRQSKEKLIDFNFPQLVVCYVNKSKINIEKSNTSLELTKRSIRYKKPQSFLFISCLHIWWKLLHKKAPTIFLLSLYIFNEKDCIT